MKEDSAFIGENIVTCNISNYVGGGIVIGESSFSRVERNLIFGNTGSTSGGGIFVTSHLKPRTNVVIASNVICNNQTSSYSTYVSGGGIDVMRGATAILVNNTIVNNYADWGGGGIASSFYANVLVANCVLWNNSSVRGPEIYVGGDVYDTRASLSVLHSLVEDGQAGAYLEPNTTLTWGSGNINKDPLFVDQAGDDHHIRYDSPCRNAGLTHSGLTTADYEGDPRIVDGAPDIGADEFFPHLWTADTVKPGGSVEIKVSGLPGDPVRLALGSGTIEPAIKTQYGYLHIMLPSVWTAGGVYHPFCKFFSSPRGAPLR